MLSFKDITVNDYETLTKYFRISNYNSCEYCFGNLFIWKERFHSQFCVTEDMLFVKGCFDGNCYYLMPCGNVNLKRAVQILLDDAKECGHKFIMHCVLPSVKDEILSLFENTFSVSTFDAHYDYVYLRDELATLSGKKFHAKRNYVNRFIANNGAEIHYEEITKDNIEKCYLLNEEWFLENNDAADPSVLHEHSAVKSLLDNFFLLHQKGAIIYSKGKVCGFCAGERLNDNTFVTHIEKASYDVEGAFAVINKEFANRSLKDFKYIDREEDMGIQGLRKAKKSYNPVYMIEKYTLKK